jgi:hypothetical protein
MRQQELERVARERLWHVRLQLLQQHLKGAAL